MTNINWTPRFLGRIFRHRSTYAGNGVYSKKLCLIGNMLVNYGFVWASYVDTAIWDKHGSGYHGNVMGYVIEMRICSNQTWLAGKTPSKTTSDNITEDYSFCFNVSPTQVNTLTERWVTALKDEMAFFVVKTVISHHHGLPPNEESFTIINHH